MPHKPPFSEADARAAIAEAMCWAEALRFLGYAVKAANYRTLQKWAARWRIDTGHFDPNSCRRRANRGRAVPLEQVLIENSTYPRGSLKPRLFATGLKERRCELCGQGEAWRSKAMTLVLDHINGISNDHRLENLRIVCPNCDATLETHCGRNLPRQRICPGCNQLFAPQNMGHRYCSAKCWGTVAATRYRGMPHPETRKVDRPPYDQLMADVESMSFLAIGRKYGVSDNAIRKWIRWYKYRAEQERAQHGEDGAPDEQAA